MNIQGYDRLTDLGIPNDGVWRERQYVRVWLVKFDFQLIVVRVFLTNWKGRETPYTQKQEEEDKHNGDERKRERKGERSWAPDSREGEGSRAPHSSFEPRKCSSQILHLLARISSFHHNINSFPSFLWTRGFPYLSLWPWSHNAKHNLIK